MSTGRDCGLRICLFQRNFCVAISMVLIHQLCVYGHDHADQRGGVRCNTLFASRSSDVLVAESLRASAGISGRSYKSETNAGWRLPGFSPVSRKRGCLVNYFHMDLPDSRVGHVSERLAQWDVVILNHDLVEAGRVSLDRMRAINPSMKVLAWVPLQGPNSGMMNGVPKKSGRDWYARRTDGGYLVPHWGGNLMNPCAQDRAWMRHVLRYARDVCLASGRYDGLMLDCLWYQPPPGLDVNADKVYDETDTAGWQEAMLFLLRELRALFPKTILVGNGGVPWPPESRYYDFVNGCMHENALGDQFGGDWNVLWNSYKTAVARTAHRPVFHFVQVDVRADRRSQQDATRLITLTENDRRRFRLGLGTTLLLDGGYFGFDRGDCLHGQLWWFDEYDLDLGRPLADYRSDRFGRGSLSREFEHGIVIVNPTEASIEVPGELGFEASKEESGNQSISVPPWDARILVKPAPGSEENTVPTNRMPAKTAAQRQPNDRGEIKAYVGSSALCRTALHLMNIPDTVTMSRRDE